MSKTPPRHPSAWALLLLLALVGPANGQGAADAAPSAKKPKATQKSRPAPRKAPAAKPVAAPAPAPAPASAAPAAAAASVPAVARPAASSAPREADYIVALVNSEPVTNQEVRARMARAQRQLSERGAPAPQAEALRQEILERLIAERAQLQYARETGLKVDAAALAQAELSIARQNQLATVAELHRRVEQDGIPVKDFQDDVRNQVLLARLREREIEPKLRVTDAEVDAFIREQTGATAAAIDLNLAMILVAVPEGSSAAELARLQARADEVGRRARAGEDFAALALEFSDANNRGRDGGVLGLRPADR